MESAAPSRLALAACAGAGRRSGLGMPGRPRRPQRALADRPRRLRARISMRARARSLRGGRRSTGAHPRTSRSSRTSVGVAQMLAIPTRRITGIEDPQMLAPDAPPVFADGWKAKTLVEARLGRGRCRARRSRWRSIRSARAARSSCTSTSIACAPTSSKALADYAPALDDHGADDGRPRRPQIFGAADRSPTIFSSSEPLLRLLADGLEGRQGHMGAMSLGVVGAEFDGKPGFVLLADVFSLEGGGHAEDLQDHDCAIARIGAMNWPASLAGPTTGAKTIRSLARGPVGTDIVDGAARTLGGRAVMRIRCQALAGSRRSLAASEAGRNAVVSVDVDLTRADDARPFERGRELRVADLVRARGPSDAARRVPPARACTRWCIRPSTATRRCRTRSSSTANMRSMAHSGRRARQSGVARMHPAFARSTPRCCSPWSSPRARVIHIAGYAPSPRRVTPVTPRATRSPTRRSATHARSSNGRAIRPPAERPNRVPSRRRHFR